ncbi:MAG: DUF2130 domain-containing protein [Defluviitaleaceae bacterium]|nr:DUF2130 domain-containing protein [Defluviitaleaceae bacterium]
MNTIKCPSCKEVFTINEAGWNDILSQVRTDEFRKEIDDRVKIEIQIAEAKVKEEKNKELENLKSRATKKINELESELKSFDLKKQNEILDEISKREQTIVTLEAKIEKANQLKNIELEKIKLENQTKIQELEAKLKNYDLEKINAIQEIEHKKISSIKELENLLENKDLQIKNEKNEIIQKYEFQLKLKEEEIEKIKDFKLARNRSTKMLGETLEQHCERSFIKTQQAGGFINANFLKDNTVSEGTKGDYIYREYDTEGIEIVSIMFEMKNEQDTTNIKQKNESFFKKLNDDRNKKNCEYAVLVSMLEQENEVYNDGIFQVMNYPKMYVVRPEQFILIIGLLRNSGLNSLEYRKKLNNIEKQNIDITNFENAFDDFRNKFGKNIIDASNNFEKAINSIDESIKELEKTKEFLRLTEKHLSSANKKTEDLTIKKLLKKSPSLIIQLEDKK